jgi:hypothetical protein
MKIKLCLNIFFVALGHRSFMTKVRNILFMFLKADISAVFACLALSTTVDM